MNSQDGKAYDLLLGRTAIIEAMQGCVHQGPPSQIGKFALVGTVSSSGSVSDIEIQPITEVSKCFANNISGAKLPKPPFAPYPLVIEMEVIP